MPRQTSRMLFPFPAENEDPYYDAFQAFTADLDAAAYADAENNNLIAMGTATFSWDAATGILSWDSPYYFSGFTTGFRVRIDGPDQLTVDAGKAIVFTMPRGLTVETPVVLEVVPRVAESDGIKIHDRIVVGVRVDDIFYFRNGVTLTDGETGQIWERPLAGAVSGMTTAQRVAVNAVLHDHPVFDFRQASATLTIGQTVVALPDPAPETYTDVWVFRNGSIQDAGVGNDYTRSGLNITLTRAVVADDKIKVITTRTKTVPT